MLKLSLNTIILICLIIFISCNEKNEVINVNKETENIVCNQSITNLIKDNNQKNNLYSLYKKVENISKNRNFKFNDSFTLKQIDFYNDSIFISRNGIKNCFINDSIMLIRNYNLNGKFKRDILVQKTNGYLLFIINKLNSKTQGFFIKKIGDNDFYYINCCHYLDYGLFFNDFLKISSISKINPKSFNAISIIQLYNGFVSYKLEKSIQNKYSAYSMNPEIIMSIDSSMVIKSINNKTTINDINLLFNSYGDEIGRFEFNGDVLKW